MFGKQGESKKTRSQDGFVFSILKRSSSKIIGLFLLFYICVATLIDREKINLGTAYIGRLSEEEVVKRSFGSTSIKEEHTNFFLNGEKSISLVISHCDKTVAWFADYFGSNKYRISEITIISKCDKEVEGIESIEKIATVHIIRQPNMGRCDHSYAHWIHERVKNLDKIRRENVVLFMKDNEYLLQHSKYLDEVLDSTSAVGFGCFLGPRCWVCEQNMWEGNVPLLLHDKNIVDSFSMSEYNHFDRDESDHFPSPFNNLRAWVNHVGLSIPDIEAVPVCYGGAFAVKEKQFLKQPLDVWRKMELGLSRANNIEEGHYAERMWAAILTDDVSMEIVSKAMVPFVSKKMARGGMKNSRTDGLMFVPLHGKYGRASTK